MRFLIFLSLVVSAIACDASQDSSHGSLNDPSTEAPTSPNAQSAVNVATEPGVQFASSLTNAKNGAFQQTFSLLAQRDITTKFALPASLFDTGIILMQFELVNPEGVVHASKWYALSQDDDAPARVQHPKFERDVPVQKVEVRSGVASFYSKILIAGTNFTRARLHGEFTATLSTGTDLAQPIVSGTFAMEL